MKTLISCFIILSLIACKKEASSQKPTDIKKIETKSQKNTESTDTELFFSEEIQEYDKEKTKSIKKQRLLKAQDDKAKLQELVISKAFYKEEDLYVLDYKYPYLNENIDAYYSVFNTVIKENYLNIEKTENQILEDKELLCDTLKTNRLREKRIIDYKIYNVNDKLLSVVLYKENYYSGMRYSTYLFDCINFDLNTHEFVYFDDFFKTGSQEEVFSIINELIKEGINSGELYYDCWEISEGDFKAYKNNFVMDDDVIKFYFDDCIICPSYTGTYSVTIPITRIMHVLKKYTANPKIS